MGKFIVELKAVTMNFSGMILLPVGPEVGSYLIFSESPLGFVGFFKLSSD